MDHHSRPHAQESCDKPFALFLPFVLECLGSLLSFFDDTNNILICSSLLRIQVITRNLFWRG